VLLNVGFGELVTQSLDYEYLSPEQARSAPIDRKSDVFALGLILYESLTGSRPFSHRSLPDYMLSVLADQPKNPCELRADLPPELGRIAMRCLEREPEGRFSNARELADALQSCSGVDAAVSQSSLAALLAEHFARERTADDESWKALGAAEVSLPRGASEAPVGPGGRRFRPLFLLLILAIALLIVAWAGVSRGASTC
jgi:serine/threonine protein kinase